MDRLSKLKRTMEKVFLDHRKKFRGFVSHERCIKAPFTIGEIEKLVFHKNLKDFPELPPDKLIFDDFAYKLMFNKLGSYLVFPKLEN